MVVAVEVMRLRRYLYKKLILLTKVLVAAGVPCAGSAKVSVLSTSRTSVFTCAGVARVVIAASRLGASLTVIAAAAILSAVIASVAIAAAVIALAAIAPTEASMRPPTRAAGSRVWMSSVSA